ncbi:unnamed protein product [Cyprideis torosa]|uniref:Uncharacterized protein n=1 Tax=Cyprideis torosa TaxID=163714 RepID=A0A7R8WG37_9CRUS|nr:unnamed protein product [Cyprideis torosa]CAG0891637.1 unnamed protein product [Cyprideis torosa]
MAHKAMPIVYINLASEMVYIVDQRLRAQRIETEKANKVLSEILMAMLQPRLLQEVFLPQDMYSKKLLRTVFDRLVHSSIMRLSQASMDKLYDLMTMVFKYQVSMCACAQELLWLTCNHIRQIPFQRDISPYWSISVREVEILSSYQPLSMSPEGLLETIAAESIHSQMVYYWLDSKISKIH